MILQKIKKIFSKPKPLIIIIAGPTGVGETTVTQKLLKKLPNAERLITTTTRKPRLGEKNRKNYYFITKKDFLQKLKKGEFFEYTYIKNRDTYYGTEKKYLKKLLRKNKNILINLDWKGAQVFKKHYPKQTITFFLKPEKFSYIKKHLLKRNPHLDKKNLEKRLQNARSEIKNEAKNYEYIIVNKEGKINSTVQQILKIIYNKYSI